MVDADILVILRVRSFADVIKYFDILSTYKVEQSFRN